MRRGWLLLTLAALTACGQKGPLYLPDKGGKVVTSAPAAAPQTQPAPASPATPKPTDKDKDQDPDSRPPK